MTCVGKVAAGREGDFDRLTGRWEFHDQSSSAVCAARTSRRRKAWRPLMGFSRDNFHRQLMEQLRMLR